MVQETSDHMAEPATATVRKAFVISLCQADSNYSQHGGGVIHHIDTLHHLKRFRNSANANGHIQPVYAQTFLQSNPAMDACDTDTTDNAPVSDKHVCRFAISDCLSAFPALSIRLKDQRISTVCIYRDFRMYLIK